MPSWRAGLDWRLDAGLAVDLVDGRCEVVRDFSWDSAESSAGMQTGGARILFRGFIAAMGINLRGRQFASVERERAMRAGDVVTDTMAVLATGSREDGEEAQSNADIASV